VKNKSKRLVTEVTEEATGPRLQFTRPVVDFLHHGDQNEEQEKTGQSEEGCAEEKGNEEEGTRADSGCKKTRGGAPAHPEQG